MSRGSHLSLASPHAEIRRPSLTLRLRAELGAARAPAWYCWLVLFLAFAR